MFKSFKADAFFKAIAEGNIGKVNKLISNGFDINWQDKVGFTGLMKAINYHQYEVAELLIDKGTDVNLKDQDEWTALMYCAESFESKSQSALKLIVFEKIIAKDADIDAKNNNGNTALHGAISKSAVDEMNKLISCGANINAQNHNGVTPLIAASVGILMTRERNVEVRETMVLTLLNHGADVTLKTTDGNTVFNLVEELGNEKIKDILKCYQDKRLLNNLISNDSRSSNEIIF